MEIVHDYMPLIRINAPEWFRRQDFRKYLNATDVATWRDLSEDGTEEPVTDLFTTYYGGTGSNDDMPEDIWAEICAALGGAEFFVWLSDGGPQVTTSPLAEVCVQRMYQSLRQLLDCTELNMDAMEPDTLLAITGARKALRLFAGRSEEDQIAHNLGNSECEPSS